MIDLKYIAVQRRTLARLARATRSNTDGWKSRDGGSTRCPTRRKLSVTNVSCAAARKVASMRPLMAFRSVE